MSRGKPKPKMRDLSRAVPTDADTDMWRNTIYEQHPMVCAIWGSSMVEHELEVLLREKIKRSDDKTWSKLTDRNGPLSSFSSKIDMGYAIGLYDDPMRANLHIVREIRNVFAHAKRVVTFDHELIINEIKSLQVPKQPGFKRDIRFIKANSKRGAMAFGALCLCLNSQILRIQTRAMRAKTARLKRSLNRRRGWGLWQDLMTPQSGPPVLLPQSSQPGQAVSPSPPIQGGLLAGLAQYFDGAKTKKS